MQIGIAADHGGFYLKAHLIDCLRSTGYVIEDFGAYQLNATDDYPDFVISLCKAFVNGAIDRGIAICGSGVGANIVANKIPGIRAALIHDSFSAHQGVEDDDMNVICLGARVIGEELAVELVHVFLSARYKALERFQRRLNKIMQLEERGMPISKV